MTARGNGPAQRIGYAALMERSLRTSAVLRDFGIRTGDHVATLVMSNVPCRVCATIEIDLPRPRWQLDLVENDRANEIKMQALRILHRRGLVKSKQRHQTDTPEHSVLRTWLRGSRTGG